MNNFKKTLVQLLFILAIVVFPFSGCNGDNSTYNLEKNTSEENSTNTKNNVVEERTKPLREFTLYTWAEYFPQSVFDKFENKHGIKVNLLTYKSEEEFWVDWETETLDYDLSTVWDASAKYLYEDDELEVLDNKNIPNLKHIDKKYIQQFDTEMKYFIPFASGFSCLLVNTDIIKDEITRYKDLWNPKYKDNISIMQSEAIGLALKKLGYSANDTNMAHVKEAKSALDELKPNLKMFNSNNPAEFVVNGDIGIAHVWSGESLLSSVTNSNVQIVYPEEGIDIWIDVLFIPKGAKNKEEAELFINFINEPEINYEIVSFMMHSTPNIQARKLFKTSDYAVTSLPLEHAENAEYLKETSDTRDSYEDQLIREFNSWGIPVL